MKKISLVTCFVLIFVFFNSFPVQAGNSKYGWVWDGATYVWKKLGDTLTPAIRNSGAGIAATIAGIELTEKGYEYYLDCMKGKESGISEDERYDHTAMQRFCAEVARNRQ